MEMHPDRSYAQGCKPCFLNAFSSSCNPSAAVSPDRPWTLSACPERRAPTWRTCFSSEARALRPSTLCLIWVARAWYSFGSSPLIKPWSVQRLNRNPRLMFQEKDFNLNRSGRNVELTVIAFRTAALTCILSRRCFLSCYPPRPAGRLFYLEPQIGCTSRCGLPPSHAFHVKAFLLSNAVHRPVRTSTR